MMLNGYSKEQDRDENNVSKKGKKHSEKGKKWPSAILLQPLLGLLKLRTEDEIIAMCKVEKNGIA